MFSDYNWTSIVCDWCDNNDCYISIIIFITKAGGLLVLQPIASIP